MYISILIYCHIPIDMCVIEWLLLNANSVIYQVCHSENKLIFNETKTAVY
jgi:hypothetical protein